MQFVKEDDVDTLKTAVVVVLLLAVLYGVYVMLNQSEPLPGDLAWSDPSGNAAWSEKSGDPAVNVELGMPQASGYAAETASPAAMPTYPNATASEMYQATTASPAGSVAPSSAAPSLPVPAPPTSAASTIAPPELIGSETRDSIVPGNPVPPEPGQATPEENPNLSINSLSEQSDPNGEFVRNSAANYGSEEPPAKMPDNYPRIPDQLGPAPSETAGPSVPVTTLPTGAADAPENTAASVVSSEFKGVLQSVQTKINDGQWYEALMKLTFALDNFDLSSEEQQQALDLLDPLAGKVIYSQQHLIEPAYQVQTGDSLFKIAEKHGVPWQLLANINGIQNPERLTPGTSLKVVRGPFRAKVSLGQNELTLYVNKLYAGRFPVSLGNDPAPAPGDYEVRDKQPGRTYYAGDGRTIPIDDPSNPFGRVWIDLGRDFCIHGTSPNGESSGLGCISLSPIDAGDLYGILSKGSNITITR